MLFILGYLNIERRKLFLSIFSFRTKLWTLLIRGCVTHPTSTMHNHFPINRINILTITSISRYDLGI